MKRLPVITTNLLMFIFPVASVRAFPPTLSPYQQITTLSPLSLASSESNPLNGKEPKPPTNRRQRKKLREKLDYERRKNLWLSRYGSFSALQSTFGTGPLLGDLSPSQARRLYHSLLPRSLLGLYEMEVMNPEELAPLAYVARIAAKEYARSRCVWTGRILTATFDQYRNLRDKGRFVFGSSSMTWEEIWDKYEAQIMKEEEDSVLRGEKGGVAKGSKGIWRFRKDEDDSVTMRVYRRILERSCETNQAFDSLFLNEGTEEEDDGTDDLAGISAKLEEDVRMILLRPKESANMLRKQERSEKKQRKAREKRERDQRRAMEKLEKAQRKAREKEEKLLREISKRREADGREEKT